MRDDDAASHYQGHTQRFFLLGARNTETVRLNCMADPCVAKKQPRLGAGLS